MKRVCFRCKKTLVFDHFCNFNQNWYSKVQLSEIWHNKYFEIFCCSCFKQEFLHSYEGFAQKILFFGLSNSGKTTLISQFKNPQINVEKCSFSPTKHLNVEFIKLYRPYIVWELGGYPSNMERLRKNPKQYLKWISKLCYFFNTSEPVRYDDSIAYFNNLMALYDGSFNLHKDLEVYFFLNKIDKAKDSSIKYVIEDLLPKLLNYEKITFILSSLLEKKFILLKKGTLYDNSFIDQLISQKRLD